jgi:hypothetical protein
VHNVAVGVAVDPNLVGQLVVLFAPIHCSLRTVTVDDLDPLRVEADQFLRRQTDQRSRAEQSNRESTQQQTKYPPVFKYNKMRN